MATEHRITAIVDAKDNTKAGLASAEKNMSGLSSTALKLGGVLAGAFAVGKMVEFGKASVQSFMDAERASRQLEYAVVSISKGTKEQVQAITEAADAMQRKSGIDADALKIGTAQLSTFGLQSESVVKLTKSLADLTVNQNGVNATADQYQSSANTIAKALNGQFGLLEKQGIRFTEAQQAMIQYGSEAEKVSALQEGLNQNLKETTDTIGNSAEGAMARMNAAWGEIQESVGSIILPALASIAEAFVPIISAVQGFIDTLQGIGEAGSGLSNFLADLDARTGIVTFFKDQWQLLVDTFNNSLRPALQELWAALQPYMPFLQALAQVFGFMLVVAIGGFIKALAGLLALFAEFLAHGVRVSTWLLNTLAPAFSAIGDAIAWPINQVNKLIEAIKKLNLLEGAKNFVSSITGKRAGGGPVSSGMSYMVGENGPELFQPSTAGKIVPAGGYGAGGNTYVFQGNTFMGLDDFTEQVKKSLSGDLGRGLKLAP